MADDKFTLPEGAHWFWSKIVVDGDCWIYPGTAEAGSLGYAAVRLPMSLGLGRKMKLGHRVAFFLSRGRWSTFTLHSCDRPRCVNPNHLREGTYADNIHDCMARGRARNGNIKLTPEDWLAIQASPETSPVLGLKYKVHDAHIRLIKRRGKLGIPMVYRP